MGLTVAEPSYDTFPQLCTAMHMVCSLLRFATGPHPSGLLDGHWSNNMNILAPVKQPLILWVNTIHESASKILIQLQQRKVNYMHILHSSMLAEQVHTIYYIYQYNIWYWKQSFLQLLLPHIVFPLEPLDNGIKMSNCLHRHGRHHLRYDWSLGVCPWMSHQENDGI